VSIEKQIRWLNDLVANIDKIDVYMMGVSRAAFEHDEKTADAVERCLQRITEVAFRLQDQAEEWMPNQDWRGVRGLGNRLRHHYDAVSKDVIWDIITLDLPSLRHDCLQVLTRLERQLRESGQ
jgi:uncharacterized protein with HEPN domain